MYTLVNAPSIKIQTNSITPENSSGPSHFFLVSHLDATTDPCHYHLVLPSLEFHIHGIVE